MLEEICCRLQGHNTPGNICRGRWQLQCCRRHMEATQRTQWSSPLFLGVWVRCSSSFSEDGTCVLVFERWEEEEEEEEELGGLMWASLPQNCLQFTLYNKRLVSLPPRGKLTNGISAAPHPASQNTQVSSSVFPANLFRAQKVVHAMRNHIIHLLNYNETRKTVPAISLWKIVFANISGTDATHPLQWLCIIFRRLRR